MPALEWGKSNYPGAWLMNIRLIGFGEIEIAGKQYDYDVVLVKGQVRKRKKKPSKIYRSQYGHTPLSTAENIPWQGTQLVIGTGFYGMLPIMPDVYEEARTREVDIVALPTENACELLRQKNDKDIYAILHITC
jgi:hypothetical protein